MHHIRSLWMAVVCAAYITAHQPHAAETIADVVSPGSSVTQIAWGLAQPEGPACDSSGLLYYCDFVAVPDNQQRGKVYALGQTNPVVPNINVPSGLAFDSRNRLIISGQNTIWRRETTGGLTILAQGDSLKQANDLSLTSQGGIFFTANNWSAESYVYYLPPQGMSCRKLLTFSGGDNFPNGIEYWEQKDVLLVCLTQRNTIMKYAVNADKGISGAGTVFCAITTPDGCAIDERGHVWVAGNRAVWVVDSTGVKIGEIAVNSAITNVCFGGTTGTTLYITGGTGVHKIETLVKGRAMTWTTPARRRMQSAVAQPNLPAPESRLNLHGGPMASQYVIKTGALPHSCWFGVSGKVMH